LNIAGVPTRMNLDLKREGECSGVSGERGAGIDEWGARILNFFEKKVRSMKKLTKILEKFQ